MLSKQETEPSNRQSWKDIFVFTNNTHLFMLGLSVLFSIASGGLQPVMAIFLGKFFDAFADFGAEKESSSALMHRIEQDVYALIAVAGGTFLIKGALFSAWLIFGELQAKAVRDGLFQSLLEKDIEWYDSQASSIDAILSRWHT